MMSDHTLKALRPAALVETSTATLDTLAVSIKALHVNNKQMTLSVFRQLPTFAVYLDDGTLQPMQRWGLVRYEIKDSGNFWLVASRNGILYRGHVFGFRYCFFDEDISRIEKHIEQARREYTECLQWESKGKQYQSAKLAYDKAEQELRAACPIANERYSEWFAWIQERLPERPEYFSCRENHPNKIFSPWTMGISERYKEMILERTEELKCMKEASCSYKELAKLPQLFIAV